MSVALTSPVVTQQVIPRDGMRQEESIAARIRAEYAEMPGLCLTREQACRLWTLNPDVCQRVLDRLVVSGVLSLSPRGTYVRHTAA